MGVVDLAWSIGMQAAEASRDGAAQYLGAIQDLLAVAIGADAIVWNDIDLRAGTANLDGRHRSEWGWLIPNMALTAHENPMVRSFVSTRASEPRRMSDLVSTVELRASRLYTDLFVPMGARYQLGLPTRFAGAYISGWALNRYESDFTRRDLDVLEAVKVSLRLLEDVVFDDRAQPGAPSRPELEKLTARERQVLELLGRGWTAAHIGHYLRISPATVRKHISHIYDKLDVHDRLLVARHYGASAAPASGA